MLIILMSNYTDPLWTLWNTIKAIFCVCMCMCMCVCVCGGGGGYTNLVFLSEIGLKTEK